MCVDTQTIGKARASFELITCGLAGINGILRHSWGDVFVTRKIARCFYCKLAQNSQHRLPDTPTAIEGGVFYHSSAHQLNQPPPEILRAIHDSGRS